MRRASAPLGWILILLAGWALSGVAAEPPKPPQEKRKPAKPAAAKPGPADPAKDKEDIYELQRLLVDTLDQVQRYYVRPVDRRKLVEAAIKGILSELEDPYSTYIGPEEMERFRTTIESKFGGIGLQVVVERGQLKVSSPLPGTPAYRAGIIAGDRIVEIGGKSTENLSIDEAVRRLKGDVGTQVTLTLIHPGKTARETVQMTRESIHVETVLGDHRNPDDTWNFMLDPDKRIAYVRITAFSRDTAEELRKALGELQKEKLRGLILDLRFNPGGLLGSAVEVADLFVSQGRIVSTAGRNVEETRWPAHKEGTFEGFPMAVLVNRYSASASEIVAACLQDHKRARIVGERTWGKGSVQNVIELEYSGLEEGPAPPRDRPSPAARSALKLTTAGYRRPNGKNIDKAPGAKETDEWGVRPDAGYELKMDDEEMFALMADRRARDILVPKAQPPKPEAKKPEPTPPKPKTEKPEPARTGPTSEGGEVKPKPPSAPAAKPPHFVDRQLERAREYLTGELAGAK